MSVSYRPYDAGDIDAVAALWFDAWQSTGTRLAQSVTVEENRERLAREAEGNWEVTIACDGERVLGFLALSRSARYLFQLFVAPEAQGRGVGAALLKRAVAAMPDGFELRCAAENVNACRFYETQGLRVARRQMHPTFGHPVVVYAFDGGHGAET